MSLEKSLFKKIKNTISAVALASILSACPHPTSPTIQTELKPQIANNVIVLQEYDSEKISSVNSDSIILSAEVNSLAPGKIIISDIIPSAPQGFIRKIVRISSDGKTLITENASLEEVVDNYSFNSTQELTLSDIKSVVLRKGIIPRSSLNAFNFSYDLNNVVLYDIDGDLSTTDDQINANGNISLNSKFNLEFKIENFELQNLTFKNITADKLNVTVTSPKKFLEVQNSYGLFHYDFKPIVIGYIPTPIPIPIIVTPKLNIDLEIYEKSSSLITATLTQNADLTLGVSYSDNSFIPIREFNNNIDFQKPQLPDEISISVVPSQKLSLWLYDQVAELYGKLSEYAYLYSYKKNLNTLSWYINGGLLGDIGIDMGVFKKFIPPYSARVLDYQKQLAQGELAINLGETIPNIKTISIQPGPEGIDDYITKNGYTDGRITYMVNNVDYLEVLKNEWGSAYVVEDALLQFPIPSSSIPNNSHISSAKLKLYGSGVNNYNSDSITINLKKINYFWNESMTWNDLLVSGEDISHSLVETTPEWHEWDVTSLVQDWVKGYANYGMLLYASENFSHAEFSSSDNSDSTKRPILEISYY